MRLIALQAESFKRLRAVRINPGDVLTPIVGRNGQGKTSVIDAVASALGGAACAPTMPIRRGEQAAEVTVDLGDIKVRRRWTAKGTTLDVFSPDGAKYPSPQAVLDKLIGKLSFDPLEFSRLPAKQQARTLAEFAGVDLDDYAARRKAIYDERTDVNRQWKTAQSQLAGMPVVEAPDDEISVSAVLAELEAAAESNRRADALARSASDAELAATLSLDEAKALSEKPGQLLEQCNARIKQLMAEIEATQKDYEAKIDEAGKAADGAIARSRELNEVARRAAEASAASIRVDTQPIRDKAAQVEGLNAKVREKKLRAAKTAEFASLAERVQALTAKLDLAEQRLAETITAAQLPVEGLALNADGVTLNGIPFGDCSGAEKLRASVAVAIALNPKLKLMLIRDGSLLDSDGMTLLANMAESAGAQVLIERVDNGSEVGVRIVDGEVEELAVSPAPQSDAGAPAPTTAAV